MSLVEEIKLEGKLEGKKEKAKEIATNMLCEGMDVALIAKLSEYFGT